MNAVFCHIYFCYLRVGEQTLCPTVFRKKNHVIITFSWVVWIGNIKTLN